MSPWKPGSKALPLLSQRQSDPRWKQLSTTDTGQHFCCCCLGHRWHLEQTVHKQKALGEEAGKWDTEEPQQLCWGPGDWALRELTWRQAQAQERFREHPVLTRGWPWGSVKERCVRQSHALLGCMWKMCTRTHTHTHPSSSKTGKSFGSRHLRKSCLIISW